MTIGIDLFSKWAAGPALPNTPAEWDGTKWVYDTSNRCVACSGPKPTKKHLGDPVCSTCYDDFVGE